MNAAPDNAGDEQAVSLEQLSQAFARLFVQAPTEAVDRVAPAAELPQPRSRRETQPSPTPKSVDRSVEELRPDATPRSIVEAMLFVGDPSNAPLVAERAAATMRGVSAEEVHEAVRELNALYAERRCPYEIVSEGAGYRLVLRNEFQRLSEKFLGKVRLSRLSQAAIEALALVAYNEPLTCDEVSKLRGAQSGGLLAQLVRRQLLRIERREEQPRQPLYFTTQRFLDLFGLATRQDLPQGHDPEPR